MKLNERFAFATARVGSPVRLKHMGHDTLILLKIGGVWGFRERGGRKKVLKNQSSCIFWKVAKPQNTQEPTTHGNSHAYHELYTTFSTLSSPFFAVLKLDTL